MTKLALSRSIEFSTNNNNKIYHHPDLGWGIYVKRLGDWERETDLTEFEALEEYESLTEKEIEICDRCMGTEMELSSAKTCRKCLGTGIQPNE